MKTPISELKSHDLRRVDVKSGDVWRLGNNFIQFQLVDNKPQMVIIHDTSLVFRKCSNLVITDEDIRDMTN